MRLSQSASLQFLIAKKHNLCDFIIDKLKQFTYILVPSNSTLIRLIKTHIIPYLKTMVTTC